MIRKTSAVILLLSLCAVFIPAQSNPTQQSSKFRSPILNRQKRTFDFGFFEPRDWPQIRQIWRLPTFPTLPTITGMTRYFDDERSFDRFSRRLAELENGQRRIVNYLRKVKADKNANGCSGTSTRLPEILPTPVADSASSAEAAKIPRKPQTTTSTTEAVAAAADTPVKFPQEQPPATTLTTRLMTEETTEVSATIGNVTVGATSSANNEFTDKSVEAVTVPTTVSEELPKATDEELTTVAVDDTDETNDVFV